MSEQSMTKVVADIRTHFHLTALPFTRELSVEKRFSTPAIEAAIQELRFTIEERGCGALTAPAGTGKTMILRALKASLPEARFKVSYFKVTGLGKRDMCRELAYAIGLEPVGQYNALVRKLQDSFREFASNGERMVLLVDEAHDMTPDVLSIFRLLTNFEMDSRLVISVLFCGQPALGTLLSRETVVAIAQRLSCVLTLNNLSREQARDYLHHRLQVVGARAEVFTEQAVDTLFEMTRGNMRATDTLALKALHVAAKRGVNRVESTHIIDARSQVLP